MQNDNEKGETSLELDELVDADLEQVNGGNVAWDRTSPPANP